MAPTLREISQALNVSRMTVSRALRGEPGVSKGLRQTILETARKLGYSRETHYHARALKAAANGCIGEATRVICLVIDMGQDEDHLTFHGRILGGARQCCQELGLDCVICSHYQEDLPLVVQRRQVDGVIRLLGESHLRHQRTACPLPWVSLLHEMADADSVVVDGFGASRQIGEHLCGLGHKRIAFVGSDFDLGHERLAGLRSAAERGGAEVPEYLVHMKRWVGGEESTRALFHEFLQNVGGAEALLEHCTAIVAYNDLMAAVVMDCLSEQGLRVPQDVSVAGFDGVLPASYRGMALTTAAIPLCPVGSEAVRLLTWRLQSPDAPPRKLVLKAELVQGTTTAAPGNA